MNLVQYVAIFLGTILFGSLFVLFINLLLNLPFKTYKNVS